MALGLQVVRPHFFNTEELMIVIKMPGEIDKEKFISSFNWLLLKYEQVKEDQVCGCLNNYALLTQNTYKMLR